MQPLLDAVYRIGLRVAFTLLRGWWWLRRPEVHGAYVAVWHQDALLVIRNSYRRGETVPCGAIDRGETPVAAAARELYEEVGFAASETDLVFACEVVVNFENKLDHAHFFELQLESEPRVRVDNREVIWAGFVAAAELESRPLCQHVRKYLALRS